MKTRFRILILAAAATVAGCASGSSGSTPSSASGQATQAARPHGSRDRITAEEIASIDAQNVLQAIQRLRPSFLQTRGQTSLSQGATAIVVYVDETRMGDPSVLERIPITDVKEIRYLNGTDATQRYGTGHGAGAIVVVRK